MVPDYLTSAEAARLIETRELSPVELVESRLDRIARLDGRLHSFIRVLADDARREVRAAGPRLMLPAPPKQLSCWVLAVRRAGR